MAVLAHIRDLALPDCWAAAGFVRSVVWDSLHGRAYSPLRADIDVIWFDPARATPEQDQLLEAKLRATAPGLDWSVKNQARMHVRNGDMPYACATDAMRYWCEIATAVAVRLGQDGTVEVAAPFGLDDVFSLIVRPTVRFQGDKRHIYRARLEDKGWHRQWPLLTITP